MNKKVRFTRVISILIIAGIAIFQGLWLYNAYQLKHEAFKKEISIILDRAIGEWLVYFISNEYDLNKGISALSVSGNKKEFRYRVNGKIETFLYEGDDEYSKLLNRMHYDLMRMQKCVKLECLDSLYRKMLAKEGIRESFVLELMDVHKDKVLMTTAKEGVPVSKGVSSNEVAMGFLVDHKLCAHFEYPYRTYFQAMSDSLICSILLFALLCYCMSYQMRIINYQKQIAKLREEFMSSMVHELKLPLSAVQNGFVFVKSYGVENLTEEQWTILKSMHYRIDNLNCFVQKLLCVWKDGLCVSWDKLNLRTAIEMIVNQFDTSFTGKKTSIIVDYQLDVDCVEADALHFPNVISNLVENAIKYSTGEPRVEIKVWEDGSLLALSVKDYGIGIPEKFQKKIFDRYFRVERGGPSSAHGFGIGLSYVKQVVEAHDGIIRVDSEVGVGTTFTVKIPLEKLENC